MSNKTASVQMARAPVTAVAGGILQRKCACGNHSNGGDCADCAKKKLQRKLSIGADNDPLELEADRVAEQVLENKPTHSLGDLSAPKIQRRSNSTSAQDSAVPASVEQVLSGSGSPLPVTIRRDMEQRFGRDFSHVRLHLGGDAAESARDVQAQAYTVGNNIVFNQGKFAPTTAAGRHLLAHELAHVVQQSGSGPHRLFRKCEISHIDKECGNASTTCKTVDADCKKNFPTTADMDKKVQETKEEIKKKATSHPYAAANLTHFLDGTGKELTMATAAFEKHPKTIAQMAVHRGKFLAGAKRRLENGSLKPGDLSEEITWTDTANAFSAMDDLAIAVGGYTLCSKVRVTPQKISDTSFKITFNEWKVQAFDCYNWDPGKGIGVVGFDDSSMCCIENAGRGQHFKIRTDEWNNTDPASTADATISATLPASDADAGTGKKDTEKAPDSPKAEKSPSIFDRISKRIFGR